MIFLGFGVVRDIDGVECPISPLVLSIYKNSNVYQQRYVEMAAMGIIVRLLCVNEF